MPVTIKTGNIFDEPVEALVNPVNLSGVMGAGLALRFKELYPGNVGAYVRACGTGRLRLGRVHVYETGLPHPSFIINFPTKRHWLDPSRLEDIDAGLEALVSEVKWHHIQSIAVPALGCGLGGLRWEDVLPFIERAFARLPHVQTVVFEPGENR